MRKHQRWIWSVVIDRRLNTAETCRHRFGVNFPAALLQITCLYTSCKQSLNASTCFANFANSSPKLAFHCHSPFLSFQLVCSHPQTNLQLDRCDLSKYYLSCIHMLHGPSTWTGALIHQLWWRSLRHGMTLPCTYLSVGGLFMDPSTTKILIIVGHGKCSRTGNQKPTTAFGSLR